MVESPAVTRRLAATLAANVAGYSRLIGGDEQGTLQRLRAIRAELTDPKISEHHGRIIKTIDDGLLVEFASIVAALHRAGEVQAALAARSEAIAVANRIEFRIGTARRLGRIRRDLSFRTGAGGWRGRFDLVFEEISDQQLKNITRPVPVYRVRAARSLAAPIRQALAPPD